MFATRGVFVSPKHTTVQRNIQPQDFTLRTMQYIQSQPHTLCALTCTESSDTVLGHYAHSLAKQNVRFNYVVHGENLLHVLDACRALSQAMDFCFVTANANHARICQEWNRDAHVIGLYLNSDDSFASFQASFAHEVFPTFEYLRGSRFFA
jgi:hypothetical protein